MAHDGAMRAAFIIGALVLDLTHVVSVLAQDAWTPQKFFEAWDAGEAPGLRGIQAQNGRRPELLLCRNAFAMQAALTPQQQQQQQQSMGGVQYNSALAWTEAKECNSDHDTVEKGSIASVFSEPMRPDAMYWDDGVRKGGGVVGTDAELRRWEGDISELGLFARTGIGWPEVSKWQILRTNSFSMETACSLGGWTVD